MKKNSRIHLNIYNMIILENKVNNIIWTDF